MYRRRFVPVGAAFWTGSQDVPGSKLTAVQKAPASRAGASGGHELDTNLLVPGGRRGTEQIATTNDP
jgi:hypothetical protein